MNPREPTMTEEQPTRAARMRRGLQTLVATVLVAFVAGAVALEGAVFLADVPPLPSAAKASVRYLSADGTLLREAVDDEGMRAVFVAADAIAPQLAAATLAVEDVRFFEHKGVDAQATARAVVDNLRARKVVRGASTITMQLARLLRPHPRTFAGKVGEAVLALAMERAYTKEEILAAYLNQAPYGAGTRGAFAASRRYFGRRHPTLSLAETALLAGLPKAPTTLNPLLHPKRAMARRDLVLGRLRTATMAGGPLDRYRPSLVDDTGGVPLATALDRAEREELTLDHSATTEPVAIHFTEWVQAEWLAHEARVHGKPSGAGDKESASNGAADGVVSEVSSTFTSTPPPTPPRKGQPQGLTGDVRTTLNADWQSQATRLTRQHIAALQSGGGRDAAVVVVDNASCGVRVMVGSAGYFDSHGGAVNAATALRQPGSTLKPFTYALAFEKGNSPRSVVADIESFYGAPDGEVFRPRNYSKNFQGPVLMGEALGQSLNVPAIRTMGLLEIGALKERLETIGITTLTESAEHYGMGLTLGNGEVRLVELVGAYAALARGGVPCLATGTPAIAEQNTLPGETKIDPDVVAMVTSILEDERLRQRAFGPRNALMMGFPIAVKTGTSSNWRDTWAVGFTDAVTIGVWTGDVEGAPTHELAGATGAGPLFHQVANALVRPANKAFKRYPHALRPTLVETEVCALSGRLPTSHCDHRTTVKVRQRDVPTEDCRWHRAIGVDIRNGLRAGKGCPKRFVEDAPVVALPGAYAEWQQTSVLPVAPSAFSPLCPDTGQIPGEVVVRSPQAGSTFVVEPGYTRARQSVELRGEIDPPTPTAQWLVDNKVVATVAWPYSAHWVLTRGTHSVRLRANGRTSEAVSFEVR